jgi:hypothetical protein
MTMHVAILLYPGCVFFEYALAAEVLAGRCPLSYCTPHREPFGSQPIPASLVKGEAIR